MLSKKRPHHPKADGPDRHYHVPTYGARYFAEPVPKFELPEHAMPADAAYQICHDELNLDGNPALNLASFVTTWMEPDAERLIVESLNKNYVDQDEYPRTTVIQERCVNMLARLYHAPHDAEAVGTGTVGSSEAIMLAGLAAKWRWRRRRAAAGKPTDRPNLVMASTVQVVWEKFARYFDVEPRYVPVTADRTTLAPDEAIRFIDENTIAVVAILGSTYTGEYEPIAAIHDAVAEVNDRNGWEVPIHVDAASGGFVAPFLEPDLNWDFRLPLVKSINVSGHKYGLVYPGIGWVVWRDRADLPRGPDLPRQLPRRRRSDVQPQLLEGGQPGHRPVLQLPAAGPGGLLPDHDEPALYGRLPGRAPGRDRPVHPPGRPAVAPPGRLPACGAATLHGLQHLRTPPRTRLDRPGVPPAGERRGGRAAAHRGPRALQPRHGRHAPRRPDPGA